MNIQPLISIIIPVFNAEQYLEQCLDSIVNQTYKYLEIICVNDGSPDNSLEILYNFKVKDDRIIVLNIENGGVSNARNTGLKQAHGEYIMFVDCDDWIDSETCESMLNAAQKNDADSVMCSYTKEFRGHSIINHIFNDNLIFNESDVKTKFHRRLFGLIGEETAHPENADLIVSPCMQLFSSSITAGQKFVDLKIIGTSEDALYQIMVYKNCKKLVYMDKPFYHYRKTNETSLTTKYKPDLYEKWQNLYDIMQKIIVESNYSDDYETALNNRIVFGLIGLGLNEISSKEKSTLSKSSRLKQIIKSERYQKAISKFDFTYLPFKWKVFFKLCKYKLTFLLVLMLQMIEFLRKRVSK